MTQDEIIRMAKEAGFFEFNVEGWSKEFERFATLVAAHERAKNRYFCQRCGKRVGDKNGVWEGIHTCTPPEDVRH